jgi:hypothetical protein
MSAWSHLPNAKHIDRIIAHVTANPAAWDAVVRDAAYNAAVYAVRDAAHNAAVYAVRYAAYNAAWDAAYNAAWVNMSTARDAAWDAILVLVAWDRAGGLMDSPAEQVKVLAILGDQAAILLYPAIRAIETTQESA